MLDEDARYAVMRGLRRAMAAHGDGRFREIADGWDAAASFRVSDPNLLIALCFWEGWADSAAHGWLYYGELRSDDWPRLASELIEAIETNVPVTNPTILTHFRPASPHRIHWLGRLRWFPRRHRVLAFLAALLIALSLTAIAFIVLLTLSIQASAGLRLVILIATLVLLPATTGGLVGPIGRALERRLIRKASQDKQIPS